MKLFHFSNIYVLNGFIDEGKIRCGKIMSKEFGGGFLDNTAVNLTKSDTPLHLGIPLGGKMKQKDFLNHPVGFAYLKQGGDLYFLDNSQVRVCVEIDENDPLLFNVPQYYSDSSPLILRILALCGMDPSFSKWPEGAFRQKLNSFRDEKRVTKDWYYYMSPIPIKPSNIQVKINNTYQPLELCMDEIVRQKGIRTINIKQ